MVIKDKPGGKLVILEGSLNDRPKWLYLFYSVCFLGTTCAMLYVFLEAYLSAVSFVICIAIFIIFFIAGLKFAKRAFASERLWIDAENLIITDKTLFSSNLRQFEKNKIKNFRFHEKRELTDHPLAGQSMDYLGFQTEQKVISEMYGEQRISFDYEDGQTVFFGKDLYSWDYEAISALLFD